MTITEINLTPTMANLLSQMLAQLPQERHEETRLRFSTHAPILLDRLQKLYGHERDFPEWLARLSNVMGQLQGARPDALCEMDRARAMRPDWFMTQHALGYCAYVDRFAGTLQGVRGKINHLQELGVTYLHLLPFLRTRDGENDGGFAVASFEEIQPALGTMQDLRDLTDDLRKGGISLCSDFILNHVADTHPWAQAAINGDPKAMAYFHTFPDRQQPDTFERTLNQVFPHAAPGNFSYCSALQRWVWTTFYPYQWDLNYANPEVFSSMVAALLHLANQGIEVFRLDSTAFLWKREGSACMNQPEVHLILQAMRCIVDIVAPGVLLKAEAIVSTRELPAYLGGGDAAVRECHLAYHSTLMAAAWVALAEQKVDILCKVIRATPALSAGASWLTYVRCHDDIGWNVLRPEAEQDDSGGIARLARAARFLTGEEGSYARGKAFQSTNKVTVHGTNGMTSSLTGFSSAGTAEELEIAKRRLLLLYGLAFCFGGMPLIYMGDELAQGNDSAYLNDPARADDSRWLQRPFLDTAAFAARHDARSTAGSVYHAIRLLAQRRRCLPELAATSTRTLLESGNDAVLAFVRGEIDARPINNGRLVYLGNFSGENIRVDLTKMSGVDAPYGWRDELSQESVRDIAYLSPWSQVWLKPVA